MTLSYPSNFPSYSIAWMIAEAIHPIVETLEFVEIDMEWADGVVCVLMVGSQDAPSMELECHYDFIKRLNIVIWSWTTETKNFSWNESMEVMFDIQDELEIDKLIELFKTHCKDKYVALQYFPTQKPKS